MATILVDDEIRHDGAHRMHKLMKTPPRDDPSSRFLSPGAANLLQTAPLLALGTLDNQGRPWVTLWGGEPGFARSLGSSILGLKTLVDMCYDPVLESLLDGQHDREVVGQGGDGRPVAGLAIELGTRRRYKLAGRMAAGSLSPMGSGDSNTKASVGELQLLVRVESSLGNCPKYLNRKEIFPAVPEPVLLSDSPVLSEDAMHLIARSDLFFITASVEGGSMSTNHRGGPPGLIRIVSNGPEGCILAYPEYSGNRLYQTLGDLMITPKAGLVIPDFETGNVLYLTGSTTILAGENAAALIPHSNLVVTIKVEALRLVQHGLPFRGKSIDQSPYNPPVRYLATERAVPALATRNVRAIMLTRELLTPSIARFRFKISDPRAIGGWKPGQYAALSFEDKLSGGYSHMRDDDPKSLNDDFTRTFTISAPPKGGGALDDEFEMTIRKVGVVTNFMFRQNLRAGLEIPLYGFGGDFFISQGVENIVPFVAGGIGITSLLGQLSILNVSRLRLFWANHASDLGLVEDTFRRTPELATSTSLFISGFTGTQSQLAILNPIEVSGVRVVKRRMSLLDLEESMSIADEWYICAGPALRTNLLQWLAGKEVVYEDFSY